MTLFIKIILLTTCLKRIGSQASDFESGRNRARGDNLDLLPNSLLPCEDNVVVKRCDGDLYRYYYDEGEETCLNIEDNQCLQTKNAFINLEQCNHECSESNYECQVEHTLVNCDSENQRYIYYYDGANNICKIVEQPGKCPLSPNRFDSIDKCINKCVLKMEKCLFIPKSVNCGVGQREIYFYDPKINQCVQFSNGKCGNSPNRFASKNKCEEECIPSKTEIEIILAPDDPPEGDPAPDDPPEGDPAPEDPPERDPDPFTIPNLNPRVENVCKVKPKSGTCDTGNNNAYYYYAHKNKCKKFRNNKCGASENRFLTKKRCEAQCLKEVCTIEPKIFKCKHNKKSMYFFDPKDMKCKKYNKKSCPKTLNKFKTEKQCMDVCK